MLSISLHIFNRWLWLSLNLITNVLAQLQRFPSISIFGFCRLQRRASGPYCVVFCSKRFGCKYNCGVLLQYILFFSAEVWMFMELEFLRTPYSMATWFEDGISLETQLFRIHAFLEVKDCCCDEGIALPVRPLSE